MRGERRRSWEEYRERNHNHNVLYEVMDRRKLCRCSASKSIHTFHLVVCPRDGRAALTLHMALT